MSAIEDKANELVQATLSNPELQAQIKEAVALMEAQGVTLYDVMMGDTIGGTMAVFLGGLDPDVAVTIAALQAKATKDSVEYRKAQEAVEAVVQEDATSGTRFPSNA